MVSMMHCEHTPRESKRGIGRCVIDAQVNLRNGNPKYWCSTHGMAASRPDGSPMEACSAAWAEPVPPELRLEVDLAEGEVAMWGVVAPALAFGEPPTGVGKIHVHRRAAAGADKEIDGSYDLIDVVHGRRRVQVEGVAAVARSLSELSSVDVRAIRCSHCGEIHIDELMFATRPHSSHQCNSCGRNFRDSTGPSVSNPLADLFTELGVPRPPAPVRAAREIDIQLEDFAAVALWPSNAAFVSTMSRPEETGIHVHAWRAEATGEPDVDETYGQVTINGVAVDEAALRLLAVQRQLADGAPIQALDCDHCGTPLLSPTAGWMQPTTTHVCTGCSGTTRTRRKAFLNPLVDKF